jgi:glycosyltransferase involved in cell wall biosynthesis
LKIAVDATYSLGRNLSGIGVYSRELLYELAALQPDVDWRWLYRAHRFRHALGGNLPPNARRGVLFEDAPWRTSDNFHGLNQRLPRKRFARQVVTFHDLFVMTAEYSELEFRARFTEHARRAAGEADRIIAVSEFTASQVVDLLGVERSRVSVIPHGLRTLPAVDIPREKIILHVGAIQKRKNLARLVRAFDCLPADWKLVLAGSDGYAADEVHRAIEESMSRDRITATGYVSPAELAKWYARAMIFAFPSLDEGFGMPVLEAMAAGVPVVASSGSAVGEVAGDSAILIDSRSDESLIDGLRRVAGDENLQAALIEKGRKHSAGYTWKKAASLTFEVYRELFVRDNL